MKIREKKKEKKKFVRILIGLSETGQRGIKKPIFTINIDSTSPEEVYNELKRKLEEEE